MDLEEDQSADNTSYQEFAKKEETGKKKDKKMSSLEQARAKKKEEERQEVDQAKKESMGKLKQRGGYMQLQSNIHYMTSGGLVMILLLALGLFAIMKGFPILISFIRSILSGMVN